jgi:3-hydroxyacyl-CoA dehydrogenase
MANWKQEDYLGQPLKYGDYVIAAYSAPPDQLATFQVVKVNEKTIRIRRLGAKKAKGFYRYGKDVVKVDPKLLTLQALKGPRV